MGNALLVILGLAAGSTLEDQRSYSSVPGAKEQVAQAYSNRCRKPDGGVCIVRTKKVGESCDCNGDSGKIVP